MVTRSIASTMKTIIAVGMLLLLRKNRFVHLLAEVVACGRGGRRGQLYVEAFVIIIFLVLIFLFVLVGIIPHLHLPAT